MSEIDIMESSLPLPDNGRPIQVGDISFVYQNTYHPIYWVGDDPYRPRVETLVVKNGKEIFLRMYDKCEEGSMYRYRIPGGSLDNDSTKEQQAENETNEEALLSVSEIHNTGISYYQYYENGKLLKGGDICIEYKGTISDIFIAKYKGKVDKSTIEKHDLDDDMANNGKFYPIIKVCQLLRPEHIEAIMNSSMVDDNVKGSLRLILRGDKKTKIPEAPVKENLETYLTRPKYIGKNILLYHGSPTKIDRIDPISCNNGTRISGFRMSSFWSDNLGVSIAFSLAQILNGTQVLARFGIDETGNAGLMVVGSNQQTIKSLLQDRVIYIHKKSMPSKMVGRGHARGLQEFTIDIPVVPDEIDTLSYNDYCDYIHYITTDQYEKQKMLSERKNRYVANSKDNIMEKILYYKKDELKKKVKEFKSYAKESNDIVTEGSVSLPMMLYHGGRNLYDELRPTGIDFGNAFQKMGWSLFCWTKYSSAIGWGVFSVLKHLQSLDSNISIQGCRNSQTPIIDERVYNYLKETLDKVPESDKVFYVYSVKPKSDYKLGLGHSSNTPNCITVRKDHIKPDKIDRFVLDINLIGKYCMVVPIGYEVTAKDMGLNGRATSFLMTKDYMYNHKARKPLTTAHNSGDLMVGDDIEKYAKEHDIPINKVKFSKRMHDILHEAVTSEDTPYECKTPKEFQSWMSKNIRYNHQNTVRSADDVLSSKMGDCHDQSILEDEWFTKKKIPHGRLFMIEYNKDKGSKWWEQACGSTHTILYFRQSFRLYWFENAWENNRGIHGPYKSMDELKEDIRSKWHFEPGYNELAILPLGKVEPGMTLDEYVMSSAPITESTNLSLWGNPVPKDVVLYHASPTQGIKYIEPRQTLAYKDLGPVVFASRYKSFSACFGTYWNENTMRLGTDPDDLEKASLWIIDKAYDWSKPCSMYILENDGSFRELQGHPHEYISPNKIKVKREIKFDSYYSMVKAYDIEVFDNATKQRLLVTESAITEMTTSSSLDKDYTKGERLNLSSFKKIKISKSVIDKMKKTIKSLSHVRLDNTDGYIYTDENKPVAVIVVETKDNGEKWIQALEIFGEYKGHGLSNQLLDVAVNELSATELSVNKKNDVAYSLYKKYGFKTKSETDNMYMMTLENYYTTTESLETLINRPFLPKKVTLYHGTDTEFDIIRPTSLNAGTILSEPRMSSFWSFDERVSILMALRVILMKYANMDKFITDLENFKCYVCGNLDTLKIIETVLNQHPVILYTVSVDKSMIGMGHHPELNEASIDVPIRPQSNKKLYFNDLRSIFELVDDSTYESILNKVMKLKGKKFGRDGYGLFTNVLFHSDKKTMQIRKKCKSLVKQPTTESESYNGSLYRITYDGEGIYNAIKTQVSPDVWKDILSSDTVSWLPKPPDYTESNVSYFTKKGFDKFTKDTMPLFSKYIKDPKLISMDKLTGVSNVVYVDDYQVVTEAKSIGANTTGMKRSELPDEMFGIPSQRKYELDTEKHVRSAIKLFNWVEPKYEKELASNIIKRMKYFNITDVNVGPNNRFGKYYKGGKNK